MKAIVQEKYGSADDLELREVAKPLPGDDEVLVRVRAASLHPDVWHVVAGRPYILRLMELGFPNPRTIPGTDMAGIVESVGKSVTQFRPGDAVFGETIAKLQWIHGGAFAEYVSVQQDLLALKPGNITFEQAAAVPTSGFLTFCPSKNPESVAAGEEGADQRSGRRNGHASIADDEGARGARHCRGQHGEAGYAPLTRGR